MLLPQLPYPVESVLGVWSNKAGQLSLLKWLITIPPEQLDLTRTRPVELLEELSPLPSKSLNLAQLHPCWLSVTFLETILHLALPELYSTVRSLLEPVLKTCPEAVMLGLAQVQVLAPLSPHLSHSLTLTLSLSLYLSPTHRLTTAIEPGCHGAPRRAVLASLGSVH